MFSLNDTLAVVLVMLSVTREQLVVVHLTVLSRCALHSHTAVKLLVAATFFAFALGGVSASAELRQLYLSNITKWSL